MQWPWFIRLWTVKDDLRLCNQVEGPVRLLKRQTFENSQILTKKQMESDLFAVSSEQGGHQNFLKFATVTWNMNSGGAARKAEGWLCPWHTKWSAFAPSADYLKLLKLIKAAAQMYKEALVRAARHQTHLWPCSSNQQRHPLSKMANLKVSRLKLLYKQLL